jgi:hypothetical protein
MKNLEKLENYCFNYSVEGIMTMLLLFIKFSDKTLTRKDASEKAKKLAEEKYPGRKITIHL